MLSKSMSRLFHVGSGGGRTLVVAFAALTFLLGALPAAAAILTLNWADASTNEDGFKVERKTGSTGTYGQVANLAAETTGYADGAVTAGTTYCYRVRAYNSAGNSAYSNEVCATPASTPLYTIAVTKAGTGSGTVASSPSAINCGTTCSASVASGTSIALSATAAIGSTFTGWSGACTGTGGCALVVDAAKSLTATFATSTSTGSPTGSSTIWPNTATPTNPSNPEDSALELGVKFRASVTGYITGIRFYKGPTNTGTHVGSLWSETGTLLGQATFTNETASGWQQVTFATPVAITANTTYVASYHTNAGYYAGDNDYFATAGVTNGPLTALRDGVDGGNGVYRYGTTSGFPNQTWQSSNYWVDVVFATTQTYTLTLTKSGTGSGTVTSTPAGIACGSDCTQSYASSTDVTLTAAPATGSTFTGWSGACSGTGTCTVSMSTARSVTATFGTSTSAGSSTIWPNTATPTNPSEPDANDVELGVKFRASVTGYITGIRFYKGPTNTGTHVGSLWSETGTLLGQATFTNETASGWQQVTFATPVAITANTTYVASYHTAGYYAGDNNYFATAGVTNGPLTALRDGVDGGNGVYRYGTTSGFPNQTWQSSNYWVDVVFATTLW